MILSIFWKKKEILLEAYLGSINVLKLTSDNKYIILGSADRTIRIWDLKETLQKAVLYCHLSPINSIAIASNSKYIVSGSGHRFNSSGDNTLEFSKSNPRIIFARPH